MRESLPQHFTSYMVCLCNVSEGPDIPSASLTCYTDKAAFLVMAKSPQSIAYTCYLQGNYAVEHPSRVTPIQGVMHSTDEALEIERAAFVERAHSALDAVLQNIPFDSTADRMAALFLRQRLPPPASVSEVTAGLLSSRLHAGHLCECFLIEQ